MLICFIITVILYHFFVYFFLHFLYLSDCYRFICIENFKNFAQIIFLGAFFFELYIVEIHGIQDFFLFSFT